MKQYGYLKRIKKRKKILHNPDFEHFHIFHATHYVYCRKYIPKEHKVDRQLFINITRHIMSQVREGLLEERDGVLLDDLGYFFIFMTPKPRKHYNGGFNTSLGRSYYPMFQALGTTNPLVDFHMPYSNKELRDEIKKRVAQGQLYTHNLSLVQNNKIRLYKP